MRPPCRAASAQAAEDADEGEEVSLGIVRSAGVMVVYDGEDHLTVLFLEFRFLQRFLEEHRHVFRRIAEGSAPPGPEHERVVGMLQSDAQYGPDLVLYFFRIIAALCLLCSCFLLY